MRFILTTRLNQTDVNVNKKENLMQTEKDRKDFRIKIVKKRSPSSRKATFQNKYARQFFLIIAILTALVVLLELTVLIKLFKQTTGV